VLIIERFTSRTSKKRGRLWIQSGCIFEEELVSLE
jgi:hypothetical protein